MKRILSALVLAVLAASVLPFVAARAQVGAPTTAPARQVEPIVMLGAQLPSWSRKAAEGIAETHPQHIASQRRDAHNGTLLVPPDARDGMPIDRIVGYRWDGSKFVEIPLQIDERFPYFLANANSNDTFGPFYSGTDEELTYEWDTEAWKMTEGDCSKEYAEGEGPTEDPVPTLDDDDEVVFMASDAGSQAPAGIGPLGTLEERQEIRVIDPRDPASVRYVYLFLDPEGPSFDAEDGYVDYDRDDNADEWIDRYIFTDGHPENLGSSNTSYGPNLSGTVCGDDTRTPEIETSRESTDRFARDGVTVSTPTYRWRATGRWMVRTLQIAKPGSVADYGPDLIDRWKGRAFQQNPDSTISVVGFEDEQVNWEANSSLLGERQGPVRAIREIWGADSGTNVTKTETFYRDAVHYRYRVRVHPIPPDGLYTSWDYNHDVAECYFNESHDECIAIDGVNDDELNVDEVPEQVQQLPCVPSDEVPCVKQAYFDATDPRHSKPLANLNWEQVSGSKDSGSLVYMFEMKSPQSLENPAVVPYYRDDACLDDGTGDDPTPRQFPGEKSTDPRVYPEDVRECDPSDPTNWSARQGCFACHGIHYFITNDTDNAFMPKPVTEIDGAQWQWAVPTSAPTNVGDAYANTVKTPLLALAAPQESSPQADATPTPTPTASSTPSQTPTASATPTPTATATPTQTASSSSTSTPTQSPSHRPSAPASAAGTEPGRVETSIAASRDVVKYGKGFELSGQLAGPRNCAAARIVNISRRKHGTTTLEHVGSAVSRQDGSWSIGFIAHANASFVATPASDSACEGTESTPVTVLVRAKLSAGPQGDCRGGTRITGSVRPRSPGSTVRMERRRDGRWEKLSFTLVSRSSRFRLHAPGCGRYRIRWLDNDPTNAPASLELKLRR
jgi:hypothetical protein